MAGLEAAVASLARGGAWRRVARVSDPAVGALGAGLRPRRGLDGLRHMCRFEFSATGSAI